MPIYNEEKILKRNVLKLYNYCCAQNYDFEWQIVIIINGSSDKSENIAKKLNKKYLQKIKYSKNGKAGKGNAIKKYWISSNADIVIYMDIDLAVSLRNIEDLIKALIAENYDLAIGSRMMNDSKIDRSIVRELSSQGYNLL